MAALIRTLATSILEDKGQLITRGVWPIDDYMYPVLSITPAILPRQHKCPSSIVQFIGTIGL